MDTVHPSDPADRTSKLDRIKELLPAEEGVANELADFFKLFGDSTRIKILFALGASELCVGDIADLLSMNHSAISHQLRLLSRARLIKSRKIGKHVYYSLSDKHIKNVLAQGFEHLQE